MAGIQFLAGQRLTADALQRVVPDRVLQGSDDTVNNSTTLINSNIVVTVDGLFRIDCEMQYETAAAAGFRWSWSVAGSVTVLAKMTLAPGTASGGGPQNIETMQMRMRSGTNVETLDLGSTTTVGWITESLVVDGSGTVTLQFAQAAADASDTVLSDTSFALITRLSA